MIGAALAVVFMPKPKDVEVVEDEARSGIVDHPTMFLAGEVGPIVTIYDMLDDFNAMVTANTDAVKGDPVDALEVLVEPDLYEKFENVRWLPGIIDPGTTVYFSHDNGDTWEHVGEIA